MKKYRIGIMGGTFNPIHNGHLLLGEWAREAYDIDEVWFIPTGCSYLKRNQGILSGETRLKMVDLAIAGNPFFKSSDMEILREGDTYTYETLEVLKQKYPDAELVFITGADCLMFIENWVRADLIFQYCTLLAVNRDDVSMEEMQVKKANLEKEFKAHIELVTFPRIDISSSDIRKRIAEGKSIRYLLPESVVDYIESNSLYQSN